MPYEAKHRFARIAPRKARLVMDLIRGRDVDDALSMLKFSKQRVIRLIHLRIAGEETERTPARVFQQLLDAFRGCLNKPGIARVRQVRWHIEEGLRLIIEVRFDDMLTSILEAEASTYIRETAADRQRS